MSNFIKNNLLVRHSNAVAAGSSVVTPSAGVDTQGYDEITFLVPVGTITAGAVSSIELHYSDDDGVADAYSAVLGTNVAIADDADNKIAVVSVVRPAKRYVKCIVNRATQNLVLDGIIAILSQPKAAPVTQGSTIIAPELHIAPAEGTA